MDAASLSRENGRVAARFKCLSRNDPTGSEKNELKPWLEKRWCVPPETSQEFVSAMEDVLDLYHRREETTRPVVCVDETSKQHLKDIRGSPAGHHRQTPSL